MIKDDVTYNCFKAGTVSFHIPEVRSSAIFPIRVGQARVDGVSTMAVSLYMLDECHRWSCLLEVAENQIHTVDAARTSPRYHTIRHIGTLNMYY